MLKRLTARIGHQDFRFDPKNKILRVAVLNDIWLDLRLQRYGELNKYLDGSWNLGEITISYRDGEIWVYLVFEEAAPKRKPGSIMGVDVNFSNMSYAVLDLDGNLVTMQILLVRSLKHALHLKHMIEDLKRRRPRGLLSWSTLYSP